MGLKNKAAFGKLFKNRGVDSSASFLFEIEVKPNELIQCHHLTRQTSELFYFQMSNYFHQVWFSFCAAICNSGFHGLERAQVNRSILHIIVFDFLYMCVCVCPLLVLVRVRVCVEKEKGKRKKIKRKSDRRRKQEKEKLFKPLQKKKKSFKKYYLQVLIDWIFLGKQNP